MLRCGLLVVLLSPTTGAQTLRPLDYTPAPVQALPAGEDTITPLGKGAQAPYTGQLLDEPTALRWMHYLEQYKVRLREDVVYERTMCNAYLAYDAERLRLSEDARASIVASAEAAAKRADELNAHLQQEASSPGVLKSPILWMSVGLVLGAAAVGLGASVGH